MIILFVNAHRNSPQGTIRFQTYYSQLKKILKNTIYYGNQIQEVIKNKNQLQDYIYDDYSYRNKAKSQEMFASLDYVFIDGDVTTPPWAPNCQHLFLLVKACIQQNKKIHCNGSAHLSAYFYLTTFFEKPPNICSTRLLTPDILKKLDYQYENQTGDLLIKGNKVMNSGLKTLSQTMRPFSAKSRQAINNGAILPTKYHYVVFNSKNGQKILSNISFPFTFYWKGVILCTPKTVSKTKANILVQTQSGSPFAFTYSNCLSTQGLSPQFLLIIHNWLNQSSGKMLQFNQKFTFDKFQTISLDNQINMHKAIANKDDLKTISHNNDIKSIYQKSHLLTVSRMSSVKVSSRKTETEKSKILTQKLLKQKIQAPIIRCSSKYETQEDRYMEIARFNRSKNLGKSRLNFKGNLAQGEIKNYITLTISRPVSAHKFREVDKSKWTGQKNFFLS